jgi:1,4-dihydroxy-2-naphthoyl-CoA hydrolase
VIDEAGWSLPEGQTTTFEEHHGISFEPTGEADGSWQAWFDVDDRDRQLMGIVHGGMYAALAETVASVGTLAAVVDQGLICMGQANATNFLRPATEGRVEALAVPLHRGRTTWVWDVEMTSAGKRVARSTVTIAVRPRPGPPA